MNTPTHTGPKTWFITGASSGFGLAFARYALAHGDNVVAAVRTPSKIANFAAANPERVLVTPLDVTKPGDAERAVAAAVGRFGRIDYLFNNAGYGVVGAVEETPDAELRAVMETNFFGAVNVTKAVLPVLRAQRSGAVVNISSMGGAMSLQGFSAYSATKFALEGMSEALALELAPFGIKVLIVEPGAFRTDFGSDALKHMPLMDAYRDVVGGIRNAMHTMHNAQPGDPDKAARAVAQALEAETTPLRLQLGADAIAAVRTHGEKLLADLAKWEPVGLATTIGA